MDGGAVHGVLWWVLEVLLTVAVLSVFKRGLPPYGWRRQQQGRDRRPVGTR